MLIAINTYSDGHGRYVFMSTQCSHQLIHFHKYFWNNNYLIKNATLITWYWIVIFVFFYWMICRLCHLGWKWWRAIRFFLKHEKCNKRLTFCQPNFWGINYSNTGLPASLLKDLLPHLSIYDLTRLQPALNQRGTWCFRDGLVRTTSTPAPDMCGPLLSRSHITWRSYFYMRIIT